MQIYILEDAGILEWFWRNSWWCRLWNSYFLLRDRNWPERCRWVNRNRTCVYFLRVWLVFLLRFRWTRWTKVIFRCDIPTKWIMISSTRCSVCDSNTNENKIWIRLNKISTSECITASIKILKLKLQKFTYSSGNIT